MMPMKRVLFLVSHFGSQSEQVSTLLEKYSRVQFYDLEAIYRHPLDLTLLTALPHKNTTSAAIYGVRLLLNDNFAGRCLYKICNFIYYIRPARETMAEILQNNLFPAANALDYYVIRIRRIYEMALQTPGAVLLTWENLKNGRGLDLVEKYLGLKEKIPVPVEMFTETEGAIVKEAEEIYEEYLYRMKKLDLLMLNQ
jgi:hypothetical protein